jgi:hypothetical protein
MHKCGYHENRVGSGATSSLPPAIRPLQVFSIHNIHIRISNLIAEMWMKELPIGGIHLQHNLTVGH